MLSPNVRQYLKNKIQEEHWQTIGEQDATLSLFDNDLLDLEKKKHAVKYENVKFQGEIHAKDQQIEKCKNTMTHLRESYVDHKMNPGKDNIIIIVEKHTTSATDMYHDLPYYVSRIKR